MKCIVLVGGYAKRMYPLSQNKPKALLELNNSTVLDNILDNVINSNRIIDEYILVTNEKYYNDFINWKLNSKYKQKITIISDGSTSEDNKVGAATAVIKIIKKLKINDDIFIMAGDNIIDFSLSYIFDKFSNNNNSCVMYYEESDKIKLSKTGVIELDDNNYIIGMEEKPKIPKTNYALPPFYWLKSEDVKQAVEIFSNIKKVDSMGEIIINLCKHTNIYAILMNGKRYDVGTKEEYLKLSNILVNN